MIAIKKEIFIEMFRSKLFRAAAITLLILANFILAEVAITPAFAFIVLIFSYLGVKGVLYRKVVPAEKHQKRFGKVFSLVNIMIILQKWLAYLFLVMVVLGVVVQIYFKYIA